MRHFIQRILSGVSLILVLTLMIENAWPPRTAQAAPNPESAAAESAATQTTPDRQLTQLLGSLKASLKQNARDEKGLGRELSSLKKALRQADSELQADFARTGAGLRQKNAPAVALARQQEFEAAYQSEMAALAQLVEQVAAAPADAGRQQALAAKLEQLTAPAAAPPLGSSALPFRPAQGSPPAPTLGGTVTPAYAAGTEAAAAPALAPEPSPPDLAETPETRQSPEIKALAAELGSDPVRIYEYVRNQIGYSPYAGSRKGAAETLGERTGNDWDQASLLIALLRAAGYPARYVTGTVEVPVDRVMAWTGTKTPQSALELLANSGVPVAGVAGSGSYDAVRMEHTWVEAYLPEDNYRGVANGAAEQAWMPFDPSFKESRFRPGLDLAEVAGIDPQSVIDGVQARLQTDYNAGGVTSTDPAYLQSQMQAAVQRIQEYIAANGLDQAPPESYLSGNSLVTEELGLAPLALPYRTPAITGEYAAVPPDRQEQIRFALSGANPFGLNLGSLGSDFTYESSTAALAGKSLTLSWRPATPDDEAIIAGYGGLFTTPAYLVKLLPELKVDGAVVAAGQPVGLGQQQSFSMTFQTAGRPDAPVVNPVTVGAYYAVALDLGHGNPTALSAAADQLLQLQGQLTEQNVWTDEALGRYLHLTGQAYFGQVDAFRTLLAQQSGIVEARHTSEGIVAADLAVAYLFFSPVRAELAGLHIDVDRDVISPVSATGDRSAVQAYMIASGAMGSAFEHAVFEEMGQMPALSAVRVLQLAQERGVPVYTINAENVDRLLPELQLSDSVKADIAAAAAGGKVIFAPAQEIRYYDWQGAGYIVLDSETGAAGYMISGGWAGGATALKILLIVLVAAVLLGPLLIPTLEALIGLGLFAEGLLAGTVGLSAVLGALFNAAMVALFGALAWQFGQTAYNYWNGQPGALEELILLGVIGVLALGAGALVGDWASGALKAAIERNPALGDLLANIIAWADRATFGTASRMILAGWSRETLSQAMATGGYEALSLLEALARDGFASIDQLSAWIAKGATAGDLNLILRAGLTDLAAIGVTTARDAALLAQYLRGGVTGAEIQALVDRGLNFNTVAQLGLTTDQFMAFNRLFTALDPIRADAAAWQRLVDLSGGDLAAYVANLLKMESAGTIPYGALDSALQRLGITSAAERALLRLRAEAGALTAADVAVLQEVTLDVALRLEAAGASPETITALLNYDARADILRLAYMDRMIAAESAGGSILPSALDQAIDNILTRAGLNTAGDRAALRALPYDAMSPQMQQALTEIRQFWEAELRNPLRSGATVAMHKEIPGSFIGGMLNPASSYNQAFYSGFWTLDEAVTGLTDAASAYREMALGYTGTAFSPTAADRLFITAAARPVEGQYFVTPLAPQVPWSIPRTGPSPWPNTGLGITASETDFIPEWAFVNASRVALPDGTALWWRNGAGVLQKLAEVQGGKWVRLIPWP